MNICSFLLFENDHFRFLEYPRNSRVSRVSRVARVARVGDDWKDWIYVHLMIQNSKCYAMRDMQTSRNTCWLRRVTRRDKNQQVLREVILFSKIFLLKSKRAAYHSRGTLRWSSFDCIKRDSAPNLAIQAYA